MVFGGPEVGYYTKISILPSMPKYAGFASEPVQKLPLKENDWYMKLRSNIIEQIWTAKNRNPKIRGA